MISRNNIANLIQCFGSKVSEKGTRLVIFFSLSRAGIVAIPPADRFVSKQIHLVQSKKIGDTVHLKTMAKEEKC